MKKIVIKSYGELDDVVVCVEVLDVGGFGLDEVVFCIFVFFINFVDIFFIRG